MANLVLADRYEIIEKIGDGGMAVVYKARDRLLSRFVAIKILRKEHITDTTFVNNFIREAKAAASLLHPNIVTIYDVGRDRDVYYIVMEYVEGRALSDVIAAEAPLDYKRVISIGKQMASALSLAHRNNIIHRDVKPHNILMTADGTAKITDFGIAKAMGDGTIISESGMIMGSVHYFSPEQSRGQYVDEKSDIYSLGIVLYEMLTGRVPFDADNPVTIAVMHMNDSIIPPSRLVTGVPPGLDQIVLKATAKYQSDRFGSIDEMYKALDNVNFITGIIDDPVIAGFVKPTNLSEDKPGQGMSIAAGAPLAYDEEEAYLGAAGEGDAYDGPPTRASSNAASVAKYEYVGREAPPAAEEEAEEEEDEDEEAKPGFISAIIDIFKGKGGDLPMKWKVLAIAAAVIVALLISWPIARAISGGGSGQVVVPYVYEMTQEQATDELENLGLVVEVVEEEIDPDGVIMVKKVQSASVSATGDSGSDEETVTIMPGQVKEQDPKPGKTVKKGSTVTITVAVAKGIEAPVIEDNEEDDGEYKSVPTLTGMTKESAEAAIKSAGLRTGNVTYAASDTIPEGQIMAQSPKAGESLESGRAVSFTISTGPAMTAIPTVAGKSRDEASSALVAAGFTIGNITEEDSEAYVAGQVIRTEPAAATKAKAGSAVSIVISKSVKLSDLRGEVYATTDEIEAKIPGGSYLKWEFTTANNTAAAGTIIEMTPNSGIVKGGTTVKVVQSNGTPAASVTSVTVSPASAKISLDGSADRTESFTATVAVTGNAAKTVKWSLERNPFGVMISDTGVVTVPKNTPADTIIVRATSTVDPSKYGEATITVEVIPAPAPAAAAIPEP
ncbi:MAG: protein kinase [Clostridiales Family XIII bacterium]|jgi:serine/threonine-protein kinase|nr:protein kinase [Clostridiales Family XIII bacterium]